MFVNEYERVVKCHSFHRYQIEQHKYDKGFKEHLIRSLTPDFMERIDCTPIKEAVEHLLEGRNYESTEDHIIKAEVRRIRNDIECRWEVIIEVGLCSKKFVSKFKEMQEQLNQLAIFGRI